MSCIKVVVVLSKNKTTDHLGTGRLLYLSRLRFFQAPSEEELFRFMADVDEDGFGIPSLWTVGDLGDLGAGPAVWR